ncbi:hypothetical protein [Alcaligenes faecalis]|uniref:hypothetical protein n=1 Tax=Alcaligenes faecalis TaxID=511 RepID=UPI001C832132|nr:hypothetical protein [Alcaligenes faecalis]MBX6966253.1 hypothetical protein [Providencia rettgeri]MBX7030689.1 hypothetical protein [Alcaligenes faecalis]
MPAIKASHQHLPTPFEAALFTPMIVTLPRFWLCAALALCSATAYSQNDRVLSTQKQPGTLPSIPPIPPAAPVLNYGTVLFTPDYQGVRLHIYLDEWHSQTQLDSGELATPARQDNLFIVLHYRYTNTSPRPLNPQIHRPRLFLMDPSSQKVAPNQRATQDYRYAHDLDTVGPDKINPLVSVSDVAVFEISPVLFDASRWGFVIQEGQAIRIPLSVVPEKSLKNAE